MNDDKILEKSDYNKIIEAAKLLGFIVSDHNEMKCTCDQLVMFAALVAQEAIRQAQDGKNGA